MKILFICLGNICRSPAAENILRHHATQTNYPHPLTIDSAGTEAWHTGKSPDHRMTATLTSRGIPVTGKARQIQTSDFDSFDLIITMDNENFTNVQNLTTNPTHLAKIKKLTDYTPNAPQTEVPDPYYGGQQGFNLVADLLTEAAQNILPKSNA